MRTVTVCVSRPAGSSVTTTVYSFGVSGDHSVTSPTPLMPNVTNVVPVPVIVTGAEAAATTWDPSSSFALIRTGPLGTTAASIVACTRTLRSRLSTLTGLTNTSERNTSGTTRSVASR